MNDFNPIVETVLRMIVVMLPVMAVLLLFAAAYLLGGALRHTGHGGHQQAATRASRRMSPRDAEQDGGRRQRDATKGNAA